MPSIDYPNNIARAAPTFGYQSIMPPSDETRSTIEAKLATIPAVKLSCERGNLSARVANANVVFAPIVNADRPCVP